MKRSTVDLGIDSTVAAEEAFTDATPVKKQKKMRHRSKQLNSTQNTPLDKTDSISHSVDCTKPQDNKQSDSTSHENSNHSENPLSKTERQALKRRSRQEKLKERKMTKRSFDSIMSLVTKWQQQQSELVEGSPAGSICYRCGSIDHSLSAFCGSVRHLAKDCKPAQQEAGVIALGTVDLSQGGDDDDVFVAFHKIEQNGKQTGGHTSANASGMNSMPVIAVKSKPPVKTVRKIVNF
ncbi:hypothetical protein BSLG_005981 [Batrachochytrium salamandrivorans]|nr:hypothetical protein BSLG_005981 [Batrachochytrium salamandrivorans]